MQVVLDEAGAANASYGAFVDALPEGDCRYAVYDYEYTNDDGCIFNKLVFVMWYVIRLLRAAERAIDRGLSDTGPRSLARVLANEQPRRRQRRRSMREPFSPGRRCGVGLKPVLRPEDFRR
jgi:hypothetical protein